MVFSNRSNNDYIKIKRTGIVNWEGIERQDLKCKFMEKLFSEPLLNWITDIRSVKIRVRF